LYNILNIESYNKIDFSNGLIQLNNSYKISRRSSHIFILENDKCYEGEEWHEVMIPFGGGVIIFGENITIFSERSHFNPIKYQLNIIDENKNLIVNGNITHKNVEIGVINETIVIQFINDNNELVKYLFEIEDIL
jgi:hypothetical protein